MASKKWSPEEDEILKLPISPAEMVRRLGRSRDSVFQRRARLGLVSNVEVARSAPAPAKTSYEDDRKGTGNEHWRFEYQSLERKYQSALKELSVTDQLVADIKSVAPLSYSPLPAVRSKTRSSGEPQTALLMLSDTHVGKVVTPAQTLGLSEYNFSVFLDRLKYLEESIISIRREHTNTKVDALVVAMLGDMLDGALNHSAEAGQKVTLFEQFYGAGHALAQFLRNIAPHFPEIQVKTVVGNHTRWQNQKKMPTENRFSNLDMFLYALVEALTSDIKTIKWDLNRQPFQIFGIYDWVFHAAHGDHLRGGDKALGIPNHAVGRQISTTTQLFNKHDRRAPHYYLTGHLHREITLPHATGSVMVNGGFPGLDNYALAENFNPVDPTQRFCFIHPKYGKTAEYSLSLKFAERGDWYDIPNFRPQ